MRKGSRPRVLTRCVADHHHADTERIIEFSFQGPNAAGGLISLRTTATGPIVEPYRLDKAIKVLVPNGHLADGHNGPRDSQPLTQIEFSEEDHAIAKRVADRLGYDGNHAYTSSSALWGLFCLAHNPATATPGQATRNACIIKTRELGFLVVQDLEDLGLGPDGRPER